VPARRELNHSPSFINDIIISPPRIDETTTPVLFQGWRFSLLKLPIGGAMTIQIGDTVMHWTYGLGQVVGMDERVISDQKALYYAVKVRDMTVWVPDDDHLDTRLRPPSSPKKFKNILTILSASGEPLPEDRQERKLTLVERLKDGQAESLCRLIRDLYAHQRVHPLNDNDNNLMKRSREALLSEWGFVLSVPTMEAEQEMHRLLAVGTPGDQAHR
jgi:RNA polymerase-interacting CarD/CdnL/TRCF family regulator